MVPPRPLLRSVLLLCLATLLLGAVCKKPSPEPDDHLRVAILGQSNAIGHGEVEHAVSGASLSWGPLLASWRRADDPLHAVGTGSPYPILADAWESIHGVPIAFVPAADGASGLVDPPDWQGPAWTTAALKVDQSGGVDVALWLQGETDACNEVDGDAYRDALVALAEAVEAEFGARLVVGLISPWTDCRWWSVRAIRRAQQEAAAVSDAICASFDTFSLGRPPDGFHFQTEAQMEELARLWLEGMEDCGLGADPP